MGIMFFVGFIVFKKFGYKIMIGILKFIFGYLMLGVGVDFIIFNFDLFGKMI